MEAQRSQVDVCGVLLPIDHGRAMLGRHAVQPDHAPGGEGNREKAIPTGGCLGGNEWVVGHRDVGEGDDAGAFDVVILETDERPEERAQRHPHLGRFRPVDGDLDLEVIEILLGKHEPQLPQASRAGFLGGCERRGQEHAERHAPENADQRPAGGRRHRTMPVFKE